MNAIHVLSIQLQRRTLDRCLERIYSPLHIGFTSVHRNYFMDILRNGNDHGTWAS